MSTQVLIGIDIVSVPRFKRLLSRFDIRFSQQIFTAHEWELYSQFPLRLASRFAAKEATAKALGTGLSHMTRYGIHPHDIEIQNLPNGAPILYIHGAALARVHSLGVTQMQVSLSHDMYSAIATVVGIVENI